MFWAEIELVAFWTCKEEITPVVDSDEISVTFSVNMKTLKFNKINNKMKYHGKKIPIPL